MQWKANLPNDCPPANANFCHGSVYRLIAGKKPNYEDFASWREKNDGKSCPENISECQSCGVSVYRDKNDILSLINRIPKFRKNNPTIAEGNLKKEHGKILPTPTKNEVSHCTWWLNSQIDPSEDFMVI